MTADQDSGGHQVWDVNYSDNRNPVNKCRKHGAKPTQNNLAFEKIKFSIFETFWNFERILTMCQILGSYIFPKVIGWLCWGLTSQSTIFQSCRDGAIASWVINQYFRGVKCLAQGHNTAAVDLEPRTSRSGVRHSTTEPPRSPFPKVRQFVHVILNIFLNNSCIFFILIGINSPNLKETPGKCSQEYSVSNKKESHEYE